MSVQDPGRSIPNMLVHHASAPMSDADFMSFDPADNGGTNIVGEHDSRVRIDLQVGNITAGIFRQEPGAVDINWPFTEHAVLIEGRVRITDLDTNETALYEAGDGWVIRQGSHTRWEVLDSLTKTFFQVVS